MNEGIKEYVRQELRKAEQALRAAQNLLAEVEEEYGDILRQIKEDRETGDYEPLVTFGSDEATQLVGSADRFLARIREWIDKRTP